MKRNRAVVFVAALLATACAGSGSASSRSTSRVLTAEDLADVAELNCYQAVQRLRPGWLRTRGRVSFTAQQGIRLYVDGMARGYVDEMVSIRANAVEEIRYLSAPEATSRFGTDHVDGAILVTLKRG